MPLLTAPLAWIRLVRPWNALIAGAAVWLGWASLRLQPEWQLPFWGSLSMFLMVGAGNADNDALDIETDRINRPKRPLAAGDISLLSARLLAFSLYAAAILVAWFGSPIHSLLAALMAAMLWIYNRFLKGLPLSGNIVISLLCGLAVYFVEFPLLIDFPAIAHDSLPAALFAFLVTFAREIVKDAQDVAGDRAANLRTFAVLYGPTAARKLAFGCVLALLIVLPVPMLFLGYHMAYVIGIVALGGPVLVPLLGELSRPDARFGRAQQMLKLLMLAGMISLLAGVLGR
jgi:geranylgeranylglycerol-phosphate geranylgeranyltransferase